MSAVWTSVLSRNLLSVLGGSSQHRVLVRRRRLAIESLERRLAPVIFSRVADVDGFARDANRDGIFESLDTTGWNVETQLMPAGTGLGEERGLLEFNIECIGTNPTLVSAKLKGYVNALQSSDRVDAGFLGYAGDGTLTLSDATVSNNQVASITGAVLGPFSISIGTSFVQSVVNSTRVLGLTSKMLRGEQFFVYSKEASWAPPPPPTLEIQYNTSGTNAPIAKAGGPYRIREGDSESWL